jgi:hypothetical protein
MESALEVMPDIYFLKAKKHSKMIAGIRIHQGRMTLSKSHVPEPQGLSHLPSNLTFKGHALGKQ